MAPGLGIKNFDQVETMKAETLHLEDTRSLKKFKYSQTKNFTAADIVSFTTPPESYNLLQASPYSDRAHLLDLNTLDKPLQLFAEALTGMRPITHDFATAPYHTAFNWDSIADVFSRTMRAEYPDEQLDNLHFYVIVFRSRVNQHADRQLLGELDKAAHLEAVDGGGLLKYWFGTPNEVGRNLATCLWRNRADARRGGAGPGHAQAMRAAVKMYDEWFVERLRLTVDPNVGSWGFTTWVESEEAD